MLFTALLASSALISVASAQATASTLQIQAVAAHFRQSQIIFDADFPFQPQAVLNATFSSTQLSIGQPLSVAQSGVQPNLTIYPAANASSLWSTSSVYTVAMVDLGAVGYESEEVTRHWLVNNVRLTGAGPYTLNYTTSAITNYGGPLPPSGSGPHRYCIFVLPQPSTFAAPAGLNSPNTAISAFDFGSYITTSGLSSPIAGTYFTVEQGQSSLSIEATSSVVTSTLPAFGQSQAASQTASSAATRSGVSTTGGGTGTAASASIASATSTIRSGAGAVKVGGLAAALVALVGGAAVMV